MAQELSPPVLELFPEWLQNMRKAGLRAGDTGLDPTSFGMAGPALGVIKGQSPWARQLFKDMVPEWLFNRLDKLPQTIGIADPRPNIERAALRGLPSDEIGLATTELPLTVERGGKLVRHISPEFSMGVPHADIGIFSSKEYVNPRTMIHEALHALRGAMTGNREGYLTMPQVGAVERTWPDHMRWLKGAHQGYEAVPEHAAIDVLAQVLAKRHRLPHPPIYGHPGEGLPGALQLNLPLGQ